MLWLRVLKKVLSIRVKVVYLITDGGVTRGKGRLADELNRLIVSVSENLAAIVLREQLVDSSYSPASDAELVDIANQVIPAATRYDVPLIIHTNLSVFRQLPSSPVVGLHLNRYSPKVSEVRNLIGVERLIGYSAHTLKEIKEVGSQGASYCFYSPIFVPTSKKSPSIPLGIDKLKKACSSCSYPIIALGGITVESASLCRGTGSAGVACIGSVWQSEEPSRKITDIAEAFASSGMK